MTILLLKGSSVIATGGRQVGGNQKKSYFSNVGEEMRLDSTSSSRDGKKWTDLRGDQWIK